MFFIYILCEHFVPIDILLMHKTYRPSILSVLFQLKGLIIKWEYAFFFSLSTELNIVRCNGDIYFFLIFFNKQYTFLSNTFSEFVRWTPLNNIFGSKSQTLRQQNSWSFFSSTSLAHFVWTFCSNWHPINAKTYRPSILSVLFQLKGLIIKWEYEFFFSLSTK